MMIPPQQKPDVDRTRYRLSKSKVVCTKCKEGDFDPNRWVEGDIKTRMIQDTLCFDCAYWSIYADKQDDLTIVDHIAYETGERTIVYNNGIERTAFSFYEIGCIPECFHDDMPDNAKWKLTLELPPERPKED